MDTMKYSKLITSQHKTKPNFMQWLLENLSMVNDAGTIAEAIILNFDIDNAVGVQLDTIGESIGVSRILNFQPTGGISPVLDDATYRMLLRSKIVKNQWDGTMETMQNLWNTVFPNLKLIIKDNQNMTLSAVTIGTPTTLQQQLINNGYIIPKPMGVSMSYSFTINPIFSYDVNDGVTYGGYDTGYWIT